MKISVITCCYNSAETLPATIASVREQGYDDLEYIVVDGASKDDTVAIIEQNLDVIDHWKSEPDKGIYDAMNKGLAMATGEVVGFLHSDDVYYNARVIASIAQAFQQHKVEATYADLLYVQRENIDQVVRNWKSRPFDAGLFYKGWMPAHPTFYLKREVYLKHGDYRTDFRISADYELMLRMLLKHGVKAHYIPETLIRMRLGGESNASLSNRWHANKEDALAWKLNGLKPRMLTRWQKPLSKLGQFFGNAS